MNCSWLQVVKCFHVMNVIISLLYFLKKTKVIFKIILERHRQRKEKVCLFFFFLVNYVGSPFEMTVNIF